MATVRVTYTEPTLEYATDRAQTLLQLGATDVRISGPSKYGQQSWAVTAYLAGVQVIEND